MPGFSWNHKRVYRIYRELELNLRIKPKKRLIREPPETLAVPNAMVDDEGYELGVFLQKRRNKKAAIRFLSRLLKAHAKPWLIVTDKLRSDTKPIRLMCKGVEHRSHKGLNN